MHYLVFAGLGPPIGLVCLFVWMALHTANPFDGKLMSMILGMAGLTPFSYVFGLIPALVSGWAVRQVQIRRFRLEWLWTALIGAGIGPIFVVAFGVVLGPIEWDISEIRKEGLFGSVTTCGIPTLACWYVSKRLTKPAELDTL